MFESAIFNDLPNDISASIARIQLGKLSENLRIRKVNAELYIKLLDENLSIRLPMKDFMDDSSHYFFPISIQASKRDVLAEYLNDQGIYTTFRYFPLNRVPLYGAQQLEFLGSDKFAACTLLLPQHNGLNVDDIEFIAATINRVLSTGLQ